MTPEQVAVIVVLAGCGVGILSEAFSQWATGPWHHERSQWREFVGVLMVCAQFAGVVGVAMLAWAVSKAKF